MFCCMLLYVHSSIAIILMGKRELIALLNLSSWCLVMVEWLFLAVPRGCLQFVIVVFPDHTHYFSESMKNISGIPLRVSNSLDPDQARHFVEPDPDPNITVCISYQPGMSARVCGSKKRKKEDYRVL